MDKIVFRHHTDDGGFNEYFSMANWFLSFGKVGTMHARRPRVRQMLQIDTKERKLDIPANSQKP